MPIVSFTSQVLSAFDQNPINLTWSISGGNDTVELKTVGTGSLLVPGLSAKVVRGIAFDAIEEDAVVGTFATLSAATGTTLRVDRGYAGSTFAVIYTDGTSSLFNVVTGANTTSQTLSFNGFETVTPETRRLVQLGYR